MARLSGAGEVRLVFIRAGFAKTASPQKSSGMPYLRSLGFVVYPVFQPPLPGLTYRMGIPLLLAKTGVPPFGGNEALALWARVVHLRLRRDW